MCVVFYVSNRFDIMIFSFETLDVDAIDFSIYAVATVFDHLYLGSGLMVKSPEFESQVRQEL